MTDSPHEYIDAMVKAVVGIEIKVSASTGIMKPGQNKSLQDTTSAAENMIKQGDVVAGQAMREKASGRIDEKF